MFCFIKLLNVPFFTTLSCYQVHFEFPFHIFFTFSGQKRIEHYCIEHKLTIWNEKTKARFIGLSTRILVASNTIQTIDNEASHFIFHYLNCIRCDSVKNNYTYFFQLPCSAVFLRQEVYNRYRLFWKLSYVTRLLERWIG